MIEDYFARVNTAMSRSEPDVRIGVIHPIESYWLYWGPYDQTFNIREKLESNFDRFIQWMIFGLIDFDYINEALFPRLTKVTEEAPIHVGKMQYDVIIVPGCVTLRASTVERLESFRKAGGRVIFMGDIPTLVDAVPSDRVKRLAAECECIPFAKLDLMNALEEERMLDIRYIESTRPGDQPQRFMRHDGARTNDLLHQLRRDGSDMWLFVCHTYQKPNDFEYPRKLIISMKGNWEIDLYDALTGRVEPVKAYYKNKKTRVEFDAYAQDSFLLKYRPGAVELPSFIQTRPLDLQAVKKGDNELMLEFPFGKLTNLEALYVLGNFGVKTFGRYAVITSLPEKLVFGNIVSQGLPFYSANITYH